MGYPKEAKIYEEISRKDKMVEGFILDVTPDEFLSAGSKFATAGLHMVELGMPEWENPGQSIRFPFIIVEEGADNGKEGKLVAGINKVAVLKMKEILDAAGVAITKTADGKVTFDSNEVVTKQIKVLYTVEVDSRTPEEGGKGTKYTKASSAYAPDTSNESLGI